MEHSCSGDGRQTARGAARNYTRPRPCGRAWTNRAEAAEQLREIDRAAHADCLRALGGQRHLQR